MLIRHAVYYVFARGLPGIVNFLAISVYTRILSPDDYGFYSVTLAWIGLANVVFFQWIRLSLLRFLPSTSGRPELLLTTILYAFVVVVAVTGFAGLLVIAFLHNPEIERLILWVVPLTWVQAWFELNLEVARSQLNPARYGLLAGVKAVSSLGLGVLLILSGFGAKGLLLGLLGGMLISNVTFGLKSWAGGRLSISARPDLRPLLRYGGPLTATFALTFIVSSSDRLILGWLEGEGVAGIYSAGYDLVSQVIMLLLVTINLAAYPLVVRALETGGRDAADGQFAQNGKLLLAIAVPVTFGFVFLAPQIVFTLLGESFRDGAVKLVPWVAVAAFLDGIRAYHFDLAFQLVKKTVYQVWVALAAALINLILNILLIPKYGMLGAAYATVVAYLAALIISAMWARQFFSLSLLNSDVIKLFLSGLSMIACLWPLRQEFGIGFLVGQIGLGAASYSVCVFILNVAGVRGWVAAKIRPRRQF